MRPAFARCITGPPQLRHDLRQNPANAMMHFRDQELRLGLERSPCSDPNQERSGRPNEQADGCR